MDGHDPAGSVPEVPRCAANVGTDLTTASRAARTQIRRHTVSFIFQSFNLFPGLTARENVEFGADVAGRSDPDRVARDVLDQVGLGDRGDHFAHQPSGGEQQRVAIARALATGNPILLADEPTGELDFRTGVAILELLRAQAAATADLAETVPGRITVALRQLEPESGDVVARIRALPQVASASTAVAMAATAHTPGHSVDLLAETLPDGGGWTPSIVDGTRSGGIVLAEKAARDLHVRVGDAIQLEHPQAGPNGTLRTSTSTVRVVAVHPNPMRVLAYLDPAIVRGYGLAGVANLLTVTPGTGANANAVRRALLATPQVASAEAVRTTTDGMRASLQEYLGILRVAAAVTLLLALLIAFNTASIGTDERARDHATMRAFGLPVRSVLGLTTAETVLLGTVGAALGIAGGYAVLLWMTSTTIPTVMPEIGVTATLTASTMLAALLLGVGAVAIAPLRTLRRLTRLDLPATLRVVE